ncbi:MAG: cytochrome b/b6 domain-containing protein [bacterium]
MEASREFERGQAVVTPADRAEPAERPASTRSEPVWFERFTLNQRIQHVALFTTFTLLVLTGFPLKYPDVDALNTILILSGGVRGARILHRAAAAIMLLDFFYHNIYLSSLLLRGRVRRQEMFLLLPGPKDARDLLQNLRYFLGFSAERPCFDRFSYVEKFDYWAVYWGIFIMGGSGVILWFPEFWSQFFELDIIRIAYVAHSDEALLAFLAITCWHMYNVHLNPRTFPMNRVWYTGRLTREEMLLHHPAQYERLQEPHSRAGSRTSPPGLERKESS